MSKTRLLTRALLVVTAAVFAVILGVVSNATSSTPTNLSVTTGDGN